MGGEKRAVGPGVLKRELAEQLLRHLEGRRVRLVSTKANMNGQYAEDDLRGGSIRHRDREIQITADDVMAGRLFVVSSQRTNGSSIARQALPTFVAASAFAFGNPAAACLRLQCEPADLADRLVAADIEQLKRLAAAV